MHVCLGFRLRRDKLKDVKGALKAHSEREKQNQKPWRMKGIPLSQRRVAIVDGADFE
jgi:hypothetical protein